MEIIYNAYRKKSSRILSDLKPLRVILGGFGLKWINYLRFLKFIFDFYNLSSIFDIFLIFKLPFGTSEI